MRRDILDRIDIDAVLLNAAEGAADGEMFVFDEIRDLAEVPDSWETAVINATLIHEAADSKAFDYFCADFLVRVGSEWSGLPGLLERVLMNGASLHVLSLVSRYCNQVGWSVPQSLLREAHTAFSALPMWRRATLWLDGRIRQLLSRAGDRG